MAELTRWEPFREMRRLHDMVDRVMEDAILGRRQQEDVLEGVAPVDIYQTDDDIVVEAAMPGVKPDDIDISITGDTLTIRGKVSEEREEGGEGRQYHLRERRFGHFYRSLRLPSSLDADKAEAEFDNGVLKLRLPKAETAKPKTITVKAKK
jgi:HSP20 family protein